MNKWGDVKTLYSLRTKCLVVNLIKFVHDLHSENYKMLIEEIKDLNKWRDRPWSWIGILKIVSMSVLPKFINMFKRVPMAIPANIFVKCIWKGTSSWNSFKILMKEKIGGITLVNSKTYSITRVIIRVFVGSMEQNRQLINGSTQLWITDFW